MKTSVFLLVCLLPCLLICVTRTVSVDGAQQYTSIQTAITASVNGDTVLVYPGTYYENVIYNGRNIMVASLELITGNPAYRYSTVIDGNHNGSCVRVNSHETNAEIYGFTLKHGSGYSYMDYGVLVTEGGGIRVANGAIFRISNCFISENKATHGGGIAIEGGTATIKGTIITNNLASNVGGGIVVSGDINFDSINRCSVYENYAGYINDISLSTNNIVNIYINTATVNPPTEYYIKYVKIMPSSPYNLGIMDILQSYRTEVNHDLYLAPDGTDANDGFSFATPKQSIANALHTIASDSLNPKAIYLAPGIYSSETGQRFPLNLKANVEISGDSISTPTLLNHEYETTIMGIHANNIAVSNLIIEHGDYHPDNVFYISFTNYCRISNITIHPVTADSYAGLFVHGDNCELNNIRLNGLSSVNCSGIDYSGNNGSIRNFYINDCHNTGDENTSVVSVFDAHYDSLLVLENVSVTNCSDAFDESPIFSTDSYASHNPYLRMSDVLVANNTSIAQSPIIMENINQNTAVISNCTFVNNHGNAYAAKFFGKMSISNCIFDNFTPSEIIFGQILTSSSQVTMSNNLIHGYPGSVYVYPTNQVTFNEDNFTAEPQFAGTDITNPLSYKLGAGSPCRDAGTPDTTGLYLPSYDLAGNPRIYSGIIDIGCYEWDGTPDVDNCLPTIDNKLSMILYPNPLRASTQIQFQLPEKDKCQIAIYNIKGQLIRSLELQGEKGLNTTAWDAKDKSGACLPSGVYVIKLFSSQGTITAKSILLK